jgi:hypothetical protein
MKKYLPFFLISGMLFLTFCGPSESEKREKEIQDSIRQADSIAALVVDAKSWDMFEAAFKDTASFNEKYANKKVNVSNLVLLQVWENKDVLQCYAYNPETMMLSNPSREGDPKQNLSKRQDLIQGNICPYNSDLKYQAYYFKLYFNEKQDDTKFKLIEITETKTDYIVNHPTIISISGDSVELIENSIIIKNCVLVDVNVK